MIITFNNRTKEQMFSSYELLKTKWSQVSLLFILKSGMYNGSFTVTTKPVRRKKLKKSGNFLLKIN